mmetsp:Transcript_40904/g.73927  ORF Transcript_40904/g.73927 Transcript_40904/m.73927 type:complete len:189 (-) Transcript_40904:52-618(-)
MRQQHSRAQPWRSSIRRWRSSLALLLSTWVLLRTSILAADFVSLPTGSSLRGRVGVAPTSTPTATSVEQDEVHEDTCAHYRASSVCAAFMATVAVVTWQKSAMAAEMPDDSSMGLALLPEGETDNLLENVKKYWDLAVRFQVGIFANTFGPIIREKGPLKYVLAFAVVALIVGIVVVLGAMTSYDFES